MEPPKHSDLPSSSSTTTPVIASCRKKRSEHASFLADLRDHVDEFLHASMEEHKSCFTKTIQKMFGIPKKSSSSDGVESSLSLQTTVSK